MYIKLDINNNLVLRGRISAKEISVDVFNIAIAQRNVKVQIGHVTRKKEKYLS